VVRLSCLRLMAGRPGEAGRRGSASGQADSRRASAPASVSFSSSPRYGSTGWNCAMTSQSGISRRASTGGVTGSGAAGVNAKRRKQAVAEPKLVIDLLQQSLEGAHFVVVAAFQQ
jgi:hypothetical protein